MSPLGVISLLEEITALIRCPRPAIFLLCFLRRSTEGEGASCWSPRLNGGEDEAKGEEKDLKQKVGPMARSATGSDERGG